MGHALAQLADVDGWVRWVLIAVALSPVAVLVAIVVGGIFAWVRDPWKLWRKRK